MPEPEAAAAGDGDAGAAVGSSIFALNEKRGTKKEEIARMRKRGRVKNLCCQTRLIP